MPYKLLVLDLDGTLTNSRKEITPHTLETLIQAQEQGIKIILASGRPTYGVAPIADKLRLADYGGYILSYNGSEIMNWANKEILYENRLKPELLPYLYACAKNYQFPIVTYHNEFVITRLRTMWGIRMDDVLQQFGVEKRDYLKQQAAAYIRQGLLNDSAGTLTLSRKGIFISDGIMSDLLWA